LDPGAILDLSQSLNPFAPDVASMAARNLGALRCYPAPWEGAGLLAEAMGVDPVRVMLTNGGSEAIALVAAEVGGRVRSEPEFGLHPRGDGGPLWRSDPHSPSGLLAASGQTADVWDEAFYPLATGTWSAGRQGVVVVGSLTKVFACPGLRLGYVIADDVDRFARRQSEWSVGSLALAVLPEMLESCDLTGWSGSIASARRELVEVFVGRGFTVDAGDGPWVLVHAPGLREGLAPHGVVVRDCASFGLPGVVRVAVPDGGGLTRLEAALDRVMDVDDVPAAWAGASVRGSERADVRAIVFDVGDTLVHAAAAGTPVESLEAKPIGDTIDELRRLAHRFRLAAVTDTSVMTSDDVRQALAACGLAELLEVIVTSVDVGAAKPDPHGLRLVMERLEVTPEQTLFVGDSDVDQGAAIAAGAHFVRAGGGRSPGERVDRFLQGCGMDSSLAPPVGGSPRSAT